MFCSSLRKRREWAAAVPTFLKEPRSWKECKLGTHDVAIPVSKSQDGCNVLFRFVVLSADDTEDPDTWQRIERLYHLDGSCHCAVIFLLQAKGEGHPMSLYMSFQTRMMDKFAMPIIPLTSEGELPATIMSFTGQLTSAQQAVGTASLSYSPHDILSHCATGCPLSPHATNVLSDINSCFSDLVDKTTNPEGQMILQDYVGVDAERIIRFWMGQDDGL